MTSDGRSLLGILKVRFLEEGDYRHSPSSQVKTATYLSGLPDVSLLIGARTTVLVLVWPRRNIALSPASVGDGRAKRGQCGKLLKARRGEVAERLNAAVC